MLASAGRGKDSMSTITICRERGYYDLARSYQVFVDGDLAGEVGYGGKLTVAATPGKHSVQLKIDWPVAGSDGVAYCWRYGSARLWE